LLATARQAVAREEEIAAAVAEAKDLLGSDLEKAMVRIQEAIIAHGEAQELVAALARVEELRELRRARRAMELCDQGQALIDAGDPAGARERLEKALEIDPECSRARALIETAKQGVERRESITRRVVVPEELADGDRGERSAPTRKSVEARAGDRPAEPERAGVVGSPRAPGAVRNRWLWVAAAAVVVAGIVVTVVMRGGIAGVGRSGAESSSGSTTQTAAVGAVALVIDALPWAEVLEVVDAERESVELPSDRSTPVSVHVAPGEYWVTIRGPGSTEPVERGVVVRPGEGAKLIESFERPDGRQLLERYGL